MKNGKTMNISLIIIKKKNNNTNDKITYFWTISFWVECKCGETRDFGML